MEKLEEVCFQIRKLADVIKPLDPEILSYLSNSNGSILADPSTYLRSLENALRSIARHTPSILQEANDDSAPCYGSPGRSNSEVYEPSCSNNEDTPVTRSTTDLSSELDGTDNGSSRGADEPPAHNDAHCIKSLANKYSLSEDVRESFRKIAMSLQRGKKLEATIDNFIDRFGKNPSDFWNIFRGGTSTGNRFEYILSTISHLENSDIARRLLCWRFNEEIEVEASKLRNDSTTLLGRGQSWKSLFVESSLGRKLSKSEKRRLRGGERYSQVEAGILIAIGKNWTIWERYLPTPAVLALNEYVATLPEYEHIRKAAPVLQKIKNSFQIIENGRMVDSHLRSNQSMAMLPSTSDVWMENGTDIEPNDNGSRKRPGQQSQGTSKRRRIVGEYARSQLENNQILRPEAFERSIVSGSLNITPDLQQNGFVSSTNFQSHQPPQQQELTTTQPVSFMEGSRLTVDGRDYTTNSAPFIQTSAGFMNDPACQGMPEDSDVICQTANSHNDDPTYNPLSSDSFSPPFPLFYPSVFDTFTDDPSIGQGMHPNNSILPQTAFEDPTHTSSTISWDSGTTHGFSIS